MLIMAGAVLLSGFYSGGVATAHGTPVLQGSGEEVLSAAKPEYREYRHDDFGYNYPLWIPGSGSSVSFANVFKVVGSYGEILHRVAFQTLLPNTDYRVYVAADYSDSGAIASAQEIASGALTEPDYHMVDLISPISLSPGMRFAVVVKLNAFSRSAVPTDSEKSGLGKGSTSSAGESFVFADGRWKDLNSLHPNTNVCIRAYTLEAHAPEDEIVSVSDMETELEYILDRMRNDHPVVRMDGFTLRQLDIIASVRGNIAAPLAKQTFNLELHRIFAMIGENQTFITDYASDRRYLNVPFKWLMDDGMVVIHDAGPLKRGDQILSVGGKSPDEIALMLKEVISVQNEYGLRNMAETYLTRASYLSYLGLVNKNQTVDVTVLRDGDTFDYQIPLTATRWWPPAAADRPFEIDIYDSIGYLPLHDLPPKDELDPLQGKMDAFFDAVHEKGIKNVVIDLRQTNGRHSWVNSLLVSYLDKGPVYSTGYGKYYAGKNPQETLFDGNVYVLTSNGSTGSTVLLASLLHDNGVAITVGEPTGEAPAFNYSTVSWEELPITGWAFRLATEPALARPLNLDPTVTSLYPDFPVYTSRDDIMDDRDPQMEKVKELVANGSTISDMPR